MRRARIYIIVLLVLAVLPLLILFNFFKGLEERDFSERNAPSSLLQLDLSISPIPSVGETAELTVTISPRLAGDNHTYSTLSTILLPHSFELVIGTLQWEETLAPNKPITHSVLVKAVTESNATFEALTRSPPTGPSYLGGRDFIYLEVRDDGSLIHEFPFRENNRGSTRVVVYVNTSLGQPIDEVKETVLSNLSTSEFKVKVNLDDTDWFSGEATSQGLDTLKRNPYVVRISDDTVGTTLFVRTDTTDIGNAVTLSPVIFFLDKTRLGQLFIHITGYKGPLEKIYPLLFREKVTEQCTGNVSIVITFSKKLNEREQVKLRNVSNSQVIYTDESMMEAVVEISTVHNIGMLPFIGRIDLSSRPSICSPSQVNCGEDPFTWIICT